MQDTRHSLRLQDIMPRVPKVTAVVNSGKGQPKAGLQIWENARFLHSHVISAANKNEAFRFCVGEPSARSSVWRVFAGQNASDVYIAIRSSAGLHKISLHESGDFRYQLIGMVQEDLDRPDLAVVSLSEDVEEKTGRIIHQWVRPEPSPEGWTEGFRLVIPADDLQPGPSGKKDIGDVEWIPAPDAGRAVAVRGFLVNPGRGEFDLSGLVRETGVFSFLGGFKLPSGQAFVLFSATVTLLETEVVALNDMRKESRERTHPEFDWSPGKGPRILAFPSDDAGFPTFIDARA
ncbi:lamin tail domain-containing protein [Pseudarthrobacter phenanthrenivorans]|uniref:lamin tail domain-containing protein n=1 Tax=Pseudarthrobacter phenanthrenivorans TaxID=361575 RepID=UPI00112D886D|nr:lamin tail domain-containing protein [Pseudarthrobacter phenanthrenivorans]TPV48578.1 lamin tail domain-containing protein [Pseudarthrobacter phenanthrenivorans]